MVNELLSLIARANIALAVGVVLVLALRVPTRRFAGARIAYALWLIPLLAAAACFLPARTEVVNLPAALPLSLGNLAVSAPAAHAPSFTLDPRYVLALWIGGVATSLIVLILRQTRYSRALGHLSRRDDLGDGVRAAESNEHGPAVLGVLRPIIITPADFDQRFSDEERRIVLEHERAHVAQGDPLINAIAAALQCVSWFNPFVHLGVRTLRIDQELACDAAVLATAARRSYAEAILKTQIAAGAPLGCAWPSHSLSALKERIAMLKHNLPTRTQRILGVSAVGLASFTACAVAWAAQPARVVVHQAHATPNTQLAAVPLPPDPLAVPAAYAVPASRDDADDADDATAAADNATADADSAASAADSAVAEADSALAGADVEGMGNLNRTLAELDDPNRVVTITRDGHTEHRRLTPQEREHMRTEIRNAMNSQREAMAQTRVAIGDARRQAAQAHTAEIAGREAARQGEMAARQAERQAMLATRNADRLAARQARLATLSVDSPEFDDEINALAETAERYGTEYSHLNEHQRAALRAEMERHQERIQALAAQARDQAGDADDSDDDSDN